MKLKIELSKVTENKDKKQLRFSFRLCINDIPFMLITGVRIKDNKLYLPSYLSTGRHHPLLFLYPPLLDNLREMLENQIGWHYSDYATTVDAAHCKPTERDELNLLGEKQMKQEFEL